MHARAISLLALAGVAGCSGRPDYKCQTNAQCVDDLGNSGICEPDSACSFADTSCATTQRRYADGADNGQANECVVGGADACVSDLSAGDQHMCLVRSDGTIWCWGANESGQLGDGTTTDRAQPVQTKTPDGRTFLEVRLTENSTCALAVDNTVWCWGANDTGQLGVVNTSGVKHSDSPLPIQVMTVSGSNPPFTLSSFHAKHIAAGGKHACAVDLNEGLLCWGENADGQCGQDPVTDDDVLFPRGVPNLDEGVVAVDIGDEESACLKDDGSVFEFGGNDNGQLGDGSTTSTHTPVQARITSVTSITGGDEHICAVKSDGTIWCWGYGAAIGLEDGADQSTPQRILTATSVWAGGSAFHSCAVEDTRLVCWGGNNNGQIGIGTTDVATVPTPTQALIATVSRAAASTDDTCAVTSEGQLWCWGANDRGQLGQGSMGDPSSIPLRVAVTCP